MKNMKLAMENGLIMPNKIVCLGCPSKENPFFKEFHFKTAAANIAHPDPAVKKN